MTTATSPWLSGAAPTAHQIDAALVLARFLSYEPSPESAVRASYRLIASEGVFDEADFLTAESLLLSAGMLTVEQDTIALAAVAAGLPASSSSVARQVLLAALLERVNPLWMVIAIGSGAFENSLVPVDAQVALEATIPDPILREQFLLSIGKKFNADQLARMGDLGERCVVEGCRERLTDLGFAGLAAAVRHVSVVSDQLGYDVVSPNTTGREMRLEVKTAARSVRGGFRVFISRNEAVVGSRDQDWRLVICRLADAETAEVVGYCGYECIAEALPEDSRSPQRGRWVTAELRVAYEDLEPGLPIEIAESPE